MSNAQKDDNARNNRITVRFSDAERELIEISARANHTSISDYIRTISLDDPILYSADLLGDANDAIDALATELRREGNNLNQIAYRLNKLKHSAEAKDVEEALVAINRTFTAYSNVHKQIEALRQRLNQNATN